MHPQLNIRSFGGLQLTQEGQPISGFASRKAEALFIYLVCNPRPHPRETLCALFWPDNTQSRALANLSVALSSLRKLLSDYVTADRHTIAFEAEAPHTLDRAVFENALAAVEATLQESGRFPRRSAAQLTEAVKLYKGDFLAGFNLRNVPEFEAWVLLEQERLRQQMMGALEKLIAYHQQRGQLEEGIHYTQQLLALDPLQEAAHQRLMLLYALDNQRTAALAQYKQCQEILATELGVEPEGEITALYEQILAGEVTTEDPPSASRPAVAERPLHNLPAATSRFIGREEELAHIDDWLIQPNAPLLTIIGQGGMGKTRLVAEAARRTIGEFADGVWFVPLVTAQTTSDLVGRIADTLGVKFSGATPPAEQLLTHLSPKEMLLVLDNFEQLVEPTTLDVINQLIQQAAEIKLLVSSRVRLNLRSEGLLELHGLPYPQQTVPEVELNEFAAVQLFVDTAQRIQPEFALTGQEAAMIKLCHLVGGLPLALELAASWVRVLPLDEIIAEIQHGLDLLTAPHHDVPERHRSMQAVFNQTWAMLSVREQNLYARLSVFRGGFTREAARKVARASLPLLASLTDKSLLRREPNGRYVRHPLLVQYAAEKLAADPAARENARTQHADYYAAWMGPKLNAIYRMQSSILQDIRAERENLSAAWEWAVETAYATFFSKIWRSFYYYLLEMEALYVEGAARFLAAAEAIEQRPDAAEQGQLLAQLWSRYGWFNMELSQLETTEAALEKALALARAGQFRREEVYIYSKLGLLRAWQGDYDKARHILEESVALGRQYEYARPELASTLSHLSVIMQIQGEYEAAVAPSEESLEIARENGVITMIDVALTNLGTAHYRLEKYDRAQDAFTQCVEIARRAGNRSREAQNLHNLMDVAWKQGDLEEARRYGLQAIELFEVVQQPQYIALTYAILVEIEIADERPEQAAVWQQRALQVVQTLQVEWVQLNVLLAAVPLMLTQDRPELAITILTFVAGDERAFAEHREDARLLLAELEEALPQAIVSAGKAAVAEYTLDSLIAKLLRTDD